MTNSITPEVSDRICKHMNKDHTDAIALYARFFAHIPDATAATMEKIDSQGMDLKVEGQDEPVRVEFDHILADSKDAHNTLVDMLKKAQG